METIAKVDKISRTDATQPESLLPADREQVLLGLVGRVHQSLCSADQNLGHMEEELLRGSHELFRQTLEKAAQQKADAAPPVCPHCGNKLGRLSEGHATTIQTRFGPIRVQRVRGRCKRCKRWRYPADAILGLPEEGTQSPAVQEMAALTVSKMPAPEAERVIERLTGIKVSAATLGRQAGQQGQRAKQKRQKLDRDMSHPEGRLQQDRDLQAKLALEPFTMVIELDAWNIRERDDWGQSEALRRAGQKPERWHWVYGGTCFRLSQRAQTEGGRPVILSRGYAMTREGMDGLRQQLWAEAMRRGLGHAREVLVIADGAVWIWNLVSDRFQQARQRVDFYHVSQHLWAVAHALYPQDESAAAAWVKPLLTKLKEDDNSCEVITEVELLRERLQEAAREQVDKELDYLKANRERMDYGAAKKRGEPLGSGAMESTCRQYQVRFKRTGQFWTRTGDEGLMCVETFWRNDRWHLLFPHVSLSDLSKN
jgi:hypothetical protein